MAADAKIIFSGRKSDSDEVASAKKGWFLNNIGINLFSEFRKG
jgi:hypothetical protein